MGNIRLKRTRIFLLIPLLLILGLGLVRSLLPFYYMFPSSLVLFQVKHRYLSHLNLHLDQWQYQAGERVKVYISCRPAGAASIRFYDPLRADTLLLLKEQAVAPQPVHDSVSTAGTGWAVSTHLTLPPQTPPGWYILEARSGGQRAATSLFVLPSASPQAEVALLLSTNTWNAYNFWGGKSLYTRNYAHTVSFHRPQLLADPKLPHTYANHQLFYQSAQKDLLLAHFLAASGHAFHAYAEEELHRSAARLVPYRLLILSTHSEYWSRDMLLHLQAYLAQGGSLLCLSGNTAAYVSELDLQGRTMTVHKAEENLWMHADSSGLKPFGLENNLSSFHTYAPYRVQVDTSWAFEGTGLQKGDLFGQVSETYDYTYMYNNWLQNLLGAIANQGKRGAASGLEVDQVNYQTPKNWVQLARGLNPDQTGYGEVYPEGQAWDGTGGADLGYYLHPGGGLVFNVGSLAFTGAIPHDPHIQTLLNNVLNKVLGPPSASP